MQFCDLDGEEVSGLGLGNMRLPVRGILKSIDTARATEMVDYALEHGINYFDTAYFYHLGKSEDFVGESLSRYPRESYHVATKYFLPGFPNYKKVFANQLRKLNTDYVDFYLMHSMREPYYKRYRDGGAIEYFEQQKTAGTIRHLGFSSHMKPEHLREVVTWRDWDFAQIQLNYYDWCFGTAREEYEILCDAGIPIVVMEPLRGGKLVRLPDAAVALLAERHPDWSAAEWGLRWVQRLDQVKVVLSGMGSLEQVEENIRTFSEGEVLSDADEARLFESCGVVREYMAVPCTACGYCTKNCPQDIDIPRMMDVYNECKSEHVAPKLPAQLDGETYAACITCGACLPQCPQSIPIPDIMGELKELAG